MLLKIFAAVLAILAVRQSRQWRRHLFAYAEILPLAARNRRRQALVNIEKAELPGRMLIQYLMFRKLGRTRSRSQQRRRHAAERRIGVQPFAVAIAIDHKQLESIGRRIARQKVVAGDRRWIAKTIARRPIHVVVGSRVRRDIRNGRRIELTPREYAILDIMMRNVGRPVSRRTLLEEVWNMSPESSTNIVDVYMKYVRDKIDLPGEPRLTHTVRGFGYELRVS